MRTKPSDSRLITLFLDMLAAEQGAGDNTLQAYRRDLSDFSEFLGRAGKTFINADTESLRDYLADLDTSGVSSLPAWRGGCRRCAISTASCSASITAATTPPRSCPAPSAAAACQRCCRSPTSTAC